MATTEPHGGSRPAAARTCATAGPGGTWLVSGRKTWISRLTEAAVFIVFFQDPGGRQAAAAIDATEPGLHRRPVAPAGLAGWTWVCLNSMRYLCTPAAMSCSGTECPCCASISRHTARW
ncbi:acyl-CoA dehydrogenase family protein [Nocardia sp. NPDC020380]|uniref:acyl-CoA dehydrogenase family protein n=1 Tax=Nocardia sp. NPDC020380 TaxID=3364309 RepID=UPI0037A0C5A7